MIMILIGHDVAGTEAIADLVAHQDENVIPVAAFYTHEVKVNLFAKLDQDPNMSVRKSFYETVMVWLMDLPDRYDHESRLMPYLLRCVFTFELCARARMATDLPRRTISFEMSPDILCLVQWQMIYLKLRMLRWRRYMNWAHDLRKSTRTMYVCVT
jgi:hypothetical protein